MGARGSTFGSPPERLHLPKPKIRHALEAVRSCPLSRASCRERAEKVNGIPKEMIANFNHWRLLDGFEGVAHGSQWARFRMEQPGEYGAIKVWLASLKDTGEPHFIRSYSQQAWPHFEVERRATERFRATDLHSTNVTLPVKYKSENGEMVSFSQIEGADIWKMDKDTKRFEPGTETQYFTASRYHERATLTAFLKKAFKIADDGEIEENDEAVNFGESEVIDTITSLCESIKKLHEAGIAHRDITPNHVNGVGNEHVGITDLTHAYITQGPTKLESTLGEKELREIKTDWAQRTSVDWMEDGYFSPEMYHEARSGNGPEEDFKPSNPFLNDIFAVGAMLLLLLTGRPINMKPFDQHTTCEQVQEWVEEAVNHETRKGGRLIISPSVRGILYELLGPEEQRPMITTLLEKLQNLKLSTTQLQKGSLRNVVKSMTSRIAAGSEQPFEPGQWICLETGSYGVYIMSDRSFTKLFTNIDEPIDLPTSEDAVDHPSPKARSYRMLDIARQRGMKLYLRNREKTHTLIRVTEKLIRELETEFPGQTTLYTPLHAADPTQLSETSKILNGTCEYKPPPGICNHNSQETQQEGYVNESGEVELFLSNIQLTKYVKMKLEDNEWEQCEKLKPAVFAVQMTTSGRTQVTQTCHAYVEDPVHGFSFASHSTDHMAKEQYVIPGDYLKYTTGRNNQPDFVTVIGGGASDNFSDDPVDPSQL